VPPGSFAGSPSSRRSFAVVLLRDGGKKLARRHNVTAPVARRGSDGMPLAPVFIDGLSPQLTALDRMEPKKLSQCKFHPFSKTRETTRDSFMAMKLQSSLFLDTCKTAVFADMSPHLMSIKLP
jgi:1-acyl-sn-glycerol-3-phosphate acyltransferase